MDEISENTKRTNPERNVFKLLSASGGEEPSDLQTRGFAHGPPGVISPTFPL